MTTKALRIAPAARITQSHGAETCPAARLMREAFGRREALRDKIGVAQSATISAYHALRKFISDPDLETVEAPHTLERWKPHQTVTALLEAEMRVSRRAS